ncbi:MAG: 7-carboxy-7-deazaguanine synthase QueE [Bacteroidales bacterium]
MKNIEDKDIVRGKKLPLVEQFYSIQGEGYHVGKPAYFIRIGGCDIGCYWCDSKLTWNPEFHLLVDIEEIVLKVNQTPAKSIVVTGGEPSLYNLEPLCTALKKNNVETFLETAGTNELTGKWDWICLSPKKQNPPLSVFYNKADELKVIIYEEEDLLWAEEAAKNVNGKCLLYLQPEWSRYKRIISYIVDYVKKYPQWNVSLQAHKFMRIP